MSHEKRREKGDLNFGGSCRKAVFDFLAPIQTISISENPPHDVVFFSYAKENLKIRWKFQTNSAFDPVQSQKKSFLYSILVSFRNV